VEIDRWNSRIDKKLTLDNFVASDEHKIKEKKQFFRKIKSVIRFIVRSVLNISLLRAIS